MKKTVFIIALGIILVITAAILLNSGYYNGKKSAKEEKEKILNPKYEESFTDIISKVDEDTWFRLTCSDPAAGQMQKFIDKTVDGGKTWTRVKEVTKQVFNYPSGLCFADEKNGIIITDYHGEKNYVYVTTDGGQTFYGMYLGEDEDIYSNGIAVSIDWNGDYKIKAEAYVAAKENEENQEIIMREFIIQIPPS